MARHAPPVRLRAAGPTVQTASASAPPVGELGVMNGWGMEGNYAISNFNQNMNIEPYATWNAERDVVIHQGLTWNDSNLIRSFISAAKTAKSKNPNNLLVYYFVASEIWKPEWKLSNVGYNAEVYNMVNSGSRGTTQWYLENNLGQKVEADFNPTRLHRTNCYCTQFQDNNSFGRNFAEQFWYEHQQNLSVQYAEGVFLNWWDGFYWDVCPPIVNRVWEDGTNGGTVSCSDQNQDGSCEGQTNETIPANPADENGYGGARMHRRGAASWYDIYKSFMGTDKVLFRNSTRDGLNYDFGLSTGDPYEDSEFYRQFDGGIMERGDHDFGWRRNSGTGGYELRYDGWEVGTRRLQRIKLQNKLGADHTWGAYGEHATILVYDCLDNGEAQTSADFEYARFFAGVCALNGVIHGSRQSSQKPFPPLDEFKKTWGAPILSTHPYMGDLSVTAEGFPFTLRAPDQTGAGGSKFYYVEFDNVLWVVRSDYPSVSTDAHGTGTPQDFTMPSAGSGKKWIFPDLTSFTNSGGFSTRNQAPTINNGTDVGATLSLLPCHARMLERVDA